MRTKKNTLLRRRIMWNKSVSISCLQSYSVNSLSFKVLFLSLFTVAILLCHSVCDAQTIRNSSTITDNSDLGKFPYQTSFKVCPVKQKNVSLTLPLSIYWFARIGCCSVVFGLTHH